MNQHHVVFTAENLNPVIGAHGSLSVCCPVVFLGRAAVHGVFFILAEAARLPLRQSVALRIHGQRRRLRQLLPGLAEAFREGIDAELIQIRIDHAGDSCLLRCFNLRLIHFLAKSPISKPVSCGFDLYNLRASICCAWVHADVFKHPDPFHFPFLFFLALRSKAILLDPVIELI